MRPKSHTRIEKEKLQRQKLEAAALDSQPGRAITPPNGAVVARGRVQSLESERTVRRPLCGTVVVMRVGCDSARRIAVEMNLAERNPLCSPADHGDSGTNVIRTADDLVRNLLETGFETPYLATVRGKNDHPGELVVVVVPELELVTPILQFERYDRSALAEKLAIGRNVHLSRDQLVGQEADLADRTRLRFDGEVGDDERIRQVDLRSFRCKGLVLRNRLAVLVGGRQANEVARLREEDVLDLPRPGIVGIPSRLDLEARALVDGLVAVVDHEQPVVELIVGRHDDRHRVRLAKLLRNLDRDLQRFRRDHNDRVVVLGVVFGRSLITARREGDGSEDNHGTVQIAHVQLHNGRRSDREGTAL